jgi:hypothetical protein
MMNKKLAALILAPCLAVTFASAKTDKACLKQAKADYKTAVKSCKAMKGEEKSKCVKDAQTANKQARAACHT